MKELVLTDVISVSAKKLDNISMEGKKKPLQK